MVTEAAVVSVLVTRTANVAMRLTARPWSRWRDCAKTGRSPTAWRMGQFDHERTLAIGVRLPQERAKGLYGAAIVRPGRSQHDAFCTKCSTEPRLHRS
jgi:hypothetical protein